MAALRTELDRALDRDAHRSDPNKGVTMPDTTTTTELDVDTARLVSHLADLNAKIAELTAEAEGMKAELRSLTAGDYTLDGRPALRIIPTRRFDVDKALGYVPEPLRAECYTTAADPKKVKQYLAPALADACMVDAGKPKVVIL